MIDCSPSRGGRGGGLASLARMSSLLFVLLLQASTPQLLSFSFECTTHANTEYTKPDHYRELLTSNITACCDACNADSNCGSWKVCTHSDHSTTCRLLATAPTNQQPSKLCTSGLPSNTPSPHSPSPAPSPSSPRRAECTPHDFGARGDGKTVDTDAFLSLIHI